MKTLLLSLVVAVVLCFAPQANAEEMRQIALNEGQIKNFIATQPDLAAISTRILAEGQNIRPETKKALEKIAKAHGFADFAELDTVAYNISLVMSGLDSQTLAYVDGHESLEKELESVKNDSSIPKADRDQLIDELKQAIATTPTLEHRDNIELIKRYKNAIEESLY